MDCFIIHYWFCCWKNFLKVNQMLKVPKCKVLPNGVHTFKFVKYPFDKRLECIGCSYVKDYYDYE